MVDLQDPGSRWPFVWADPSGEQLFLGVLVQWTHHSVTLASMMTIPAIPQCHAWWQILSLLLVCQLWACIRYISCYMAMPSLLKHKYGTCTRVSAKGMFLDNFFMNFFPSNLISTRNATNRTDIPNNHSLMIEPPWMDERRAWKDTRIYYGVYRNINILSWKWFTSPNFMLVQRVMPNLVIVHVG